MRQGCWLLAVVMQVAGLGNACDVQAQLLINEVLAAPARDWNGDGSISSRDDEWVELYNPANAPVTLDGYRLADADTTWRMALTGTLPSHGHLVVYGSDSYAWEKATHHTASGLSLNNAGDTVRLWKFTGADSAQVDFCTYGATEGGSDRAVGRFPDGVSSWKLFDSLNPAPSGTGCSPSPGTTNGCATAIKTTSWSILRLLYGTADSTRSRALRH